jgi:hypothetical protein
MSSNGINLTTIEGRLGTGSEKCGLGLCREWSTSSRQKEMVCSFPLPSTSVKIVKTFSIFVYNSAILVGNIEH